LSAPSKGAPLLPLLSLALLGLCLPLTWFTLSDVAVQTPDLFGGSEGFPGASTFSGMFPSSLTIDVTAWNGTMDIFVELPIWVVVAIGGLGTLLALLRSLRRFDVPPVLILAILTFALAHVGMSLYAVAASGNADFGAGLFVAAVALLLAVPANLRRFPARATEAD